MESQELRLTAESNAEGEFCFTGVPGTGPAQARAGAPLPGRAEHLSAQTHNVHAAALWFLYTWVLEQPKVVADLPRRKRTRTLPTVLTPAEVERL
jgi:hypothetical protein